MFYSPSFLSSPIKLIDVVNSKLSNCLLLALYLLKNHLNIKPDGVYCDKKFRLKPINPCRNIKTLLKMVRKVIITGATGLLGRAVLEKFKSDSKWETLGLGFSRAGNELKKVDLTDKQATTKVINDFEPHIIIHCAAQRRPDICENEEEVTRQMNIEATATICDIAKTLGAFVIYISTDYVFDGTKPPYKPSDATNPLNKYGISKLEGEKVTLEIDHNNVVLRVPVLYGEIASLDESAVTILYEKVADNTKNCLMSHIEQKFPTNTADIAKVLELLCIEKLEDSKKVKGIFQWSGNEKFTKYEMSLRIGKVFKTSVDHVQAMTKADSVAKRPVDCQLDCSTTIEVIGCNPQTNFDDGIYKSISDFNNKSNN
ncbi:DgyrCDS3718 [Dimorphilus gyrociliatus]|uniref:Methionine adenosyltransferase 2 subunit beta n=1 Tax=Dimorphilus gyrociliatus TaxID=2664684 RepID=A0A7I8VGY8_9ANNE|nr:DgyrCDS3718 [Dimorphilus gyrociliatus]